MKNKEQRERVRRAKETPIIFLPTPYPLLPNCFAHSRGAPSLARSPSGKGKKTADKPAIRAQAH